MGSKLGFHIQQRRSGWPDVVADTVPAVVKCLDYGILDEWVPVAKTTGHPVEGIFPALNEVEGEGVMQTLAQDILQGKDAVESMEKANERFEEIVG